MIIEESVFSLPDDLIDGEVEGYRYLFNPVANTG